MRYRLILALAPMLLSGTVVAQSNRIDDETNRVLQAVQFYIDGHATGDPAIMARAFHPSARLQWINDGEVSIRSLEQYLGGMNGSPAADEDQRSRRVASVEITGTMAIVKIELDYPGALITDYMQMLKVGAEWKIVNKIFYVERR